MDEEDKVLEEEEKENLISEEAVEEEPLVEEMEAENNNTSNTFEESYDDNKFEDNRFGGNDNKDLIKKIGSLTMILIIAVVVIAIIMWVITLFKSRSYDYEDVEELMVDSAKSYFEDHKKNLPKSKQVVEIADSTLVKNEYMKDLTEYLGENSKCSGKVSVKKADSKYVYTPYLNCGSKYTTTELYKVLKKKTVSSGDGLYHSGSNYVFRGEQVNNYVKLRKYLWRAVKINSDNEIMLILDNSYKLSSVWDDRYNVSTDNSNGINDYGASRIKEYLDEIYKENDSYEGILTPKDRTKLTTFTQCVGKRGVGSSNKDNSEECSETLANQKIGLLTISDYLYASLDQNCNTDEDLSCQNYNYLNNGENWYVATAINSNNYEVFYVDGNGEIDIKRASYYTKFRPVIMLNDSVMIKSGKGTETKPYKLK